jgi:membrane protein DedA with SNARE-associated domain
MLEVLNEVIVGNGPLALFILMFLNGIMGFPSSELVSILGGVYAFFYSYSIVKTIVIIVLGNLIGAYALYLAGRFFGHNWIFKIKFIKKRLNEKTVIKLAKKFQKDGAYWIGIFRCLPIGRTIVSIPAGMIKMPQLTFFIYSAIGMTLWATLWSLLGYYLGAGFLRYKFYLSIILLLLLVVTILVLRSKVHKYLKEKGVNPHKKHSSMR